jgi:hypothetical protein
MPIDTDIVPNCWLPSDFSLLADAFTGNGTVGLAITPANSAVYSAFRSAYNISDFSINITADNVSSLGATYTVILQRNLFASRPASISFTAVAFDAQSYLNEFVTRQSFKSFTIPVVARPRIVATLNSSVQFASTARPVIFFSGVNLTDKDLIKLIGPGDNCTVIGNSSLQTLTSVRRVMAK